MMSVMARIEIQDGTLTIQVEGFDMLLALRSSLSVPLARVSGVQVRPDLTALTQMEDGAALRGVFVPGRLLVGTCPLPDGEGQVFCDFRDPLKTVAIDLHHDRFRRLIVEVSDETPESARDRILAALSATA